jgi:hypothetical protein
MQDRELGTPLNNVGEPADSGISRDAVKEAKELAENFAQLSFDTLDSTEGGHRHRLYSFLGRAVSLTRMFSECGPAYQQLKSDQFWSLSRQKPKDEGVAKWVMYFITRAISQQTRNRAGKYAKIVEQLLREAVRSEDVPQRLRDGGGIDAIYAKHCAGTETNGVEGEDTRGLGNTPPGALALTSGSIGDDRSTTVTGAVATNEAASTLAGCLGMAECVPDGSAAMLQAQAPGMHGDFSGGRSAKLGRLNRIDLNTTLAVEMSPFELERALRAKRVTIYATVERPDGRDWRRVEAQGVLPSYESEGPCPGQRSFFSGAERKDESNATASTSASTATALKVESTATPLPSAWLAATPAPAIAATASAASRTPRAAPVDKTPASQRTAVQTGTSPTPARSLVRMGSVPSNSSAATRSVRVTTGTISNQPKANAVRVTTGTISRQPKANAVRVTTGTISRQPKANEASNSASSSASKMK